MTDDDKFEIPTWIRQQNNCYATKSKSETNPSYLYRNQSRKHTKLINRANDRKTTFIPHTTISKIGSEQNHFSRTKSIHRIYNIRMQTNQFFSALQISIFALTTPMGQYRIMGNSYSYWTLVRRYSTSISLMNDMRIIIRSHRKHISIRLWAYWWWPVRYSNTLLLLCECDLNMPYSSKWSPSVHNLELS